MTVTSPALRPEDTSRRTTTVLRVLTVATFIVILNETIMVNAIPVLMQVLGVDARAAQWLSTGFMLTMAVVIPTTGWLLQRIGTRAAFGTAMALFCSGTLLCALAPTFPVLLLGRVVQASGTAVMMPLLMSTVMTLVPERDRGKVMGNVSLAISVAPALGPAVSGLILGFASWRWLFGLVFPLAVLAGVVGLRLLPRSDEPREGRLDVPSVVLTAIGFGSLVYGLSQLGGGGGDVVDPVVALVVGVLGVALFVVRQLRLQRGGTPLLDLRVLRVRSYVVAVSMMSLAFMALMGAMILLPMFLQEVRGLSTLQAGLLLMPGGLTMGLLGPRVGRLYDRVGARVLVVPGAVLVAVGLGLMAWATTHAPWWVFLGLHILMSVALAFVFTPIFTSGLSGLPPHLYGHGSAMLGTLQQIAAAAGTALVITVMSTRAAALGAQGMPPVAALGGGIQLGLVVGTVLAVGVVALAALLPRGRSAQQADEAPEADVADEADAEGAGGAS